MNRLILKAYIITVLLTSILPVIAQEENATDVIGRKIINSKGEKINYTFEESKNLNLNHSNHKSFLKSTTIQTYSSDIFKDTIPLDVQNLFSIVGTSIGRKSMHTIDIDKDNVLDLICSASTQTFGNGNFWYVLNYDIADRTYKHVWTSIEYKNRISVLEVADLNGNGNYSVILGFDNGNIEIYDAANKELEKKASHINEKINSIVFADADNDNQKEIVLSTENKSYLLNPLSLNIEHEINSGANEIRVGNVDANDQNEIILSSGKVYQINNGNLTSVWNFNNSTGGIIELSDIDNDSMQEIILAESWDYVKVFDVDSKTTKYTIQSDLDINALLLHDVNNDGVDEILYGDGQWGSVFCYNSVTQEKMWAVKNPEHGVSAIGYADLDNDENEELIWGAGWTSTGSDHLYIHDIKGDSLKWRSEDIVGPFYAIATGDIDGDSQEDIVAVSYESNSGYESGVIVIIDALTKQVKWQSDGNFLNMVWTGIFDVAINDIDKDGQNEIIIAAGQAYTGQIWIIDGKEHQIESSHIFSSEDIDEFYSLSVEDIDKDGTTEIMAATDKELYIVNPSDWSIEESIYFGGNSYKKPIVKCADITGNGEKEIIICKDEIMILNTTDYSLWKFTRSDFINIDTTDYNNDGTTDIVACTSTGEIIIMDGESRTNIQQFKPENSSILSVITTSYEDASLFVYSCDGRINYYIDDNKRTVGQYLGNNVAEIEGIKIYDEADEKRIILGTSISILEISGETFHCASMEIGIEKNKVSCSKNDGVIELSISGGIQPYIYLWSNGSSQSSLSNLSAGTYEVTVQDQAGCSKTRTIELYQASIDATISVSKENCSNKGSAQIIINQITEPYNIIWSNGCTELNNTDLQEGQYSVTITDAKGCEFVDEIEVHKDTVLFTQHVKHVSCHGEADGYIQLNKISGIDPIQYQWSNGASSPYLENVPAGIYNVEITDAVGCQMNLEMEIIEPDEISFEILTSADIDSTDNWEGKVIIENISGGTKPYTIYWPKFDKYSQYLDILPDGSYKFIIMDSNNCTVSDSAKIDLITSNNTIKLEHRVYIYPNPVRDKLYIQSQINNRAIKEIAFINLSGEYVKRLSLDKIPDSIDITGLSKGAYVVKILYANASIYESKIIKL